LPCAFLLIRGKQMISIHVPSNEKVPDLNKELMSAKNIKNKQVRDSTLTGLNKIKHYF